jgi:hypothetical protein
MVTVTNGDRMWFLLIEFGYTDVKVWGLLPNGYA